MVVSATIGALISLGINLLVVVIFAIFSKIQFTWRVLLLPLNFIELYVLALGAALLMATMYVYFRDIAHLWEVLQQVLFYSIPVIYPLSMVMDNDSLGKWGLIIAKIQLLNPIAQTIQDIRHNLIAPETQPTVWTLVGNPLIAVIPVILAFLLLALGVHVFRKHNRKFAEVMRHFGSKSYRVEIDLKPALDEKTLDRRLLTDFDKHKNSDFVNALGELLPRKIIPAVIEKSGIDPREKVNTITKKQRASLLRVLKCFPVEISGKRPIAEAIVTTGGVSVREVSPKTMESKKCSGLYFAGEVLDVDAYTGGFNLQIAWSTGRLAGLSAAQEEK